MVGFIHAVQETAINKRKNMKTTTVIERNIGTNRGLRRVWIERKPLSENGWHKGMRYTRTDKANGFELVRDKGGDLKVAGAPDRPVLDICGIFVGKVLEGFDKVSIKITKDKIKITGTTAAALLPVVVSLMEKAA
tara:strand:- start:72 stop:476 length:405 start_codon:yes stop_codon:yes gene_type:complete